MTSKTASILWCTAFTGQTTDKDFIRKSAFLGFCFNENSRTVTSKSIVLREATRQYLRAMLCCPSHLRGVRSDQCSVCSLFPETDAISTFVTNFDRADQVKVETCKEEWMIFSTSNIVSLYPNKAKGRTNAQRVSREDVQSRFVMVL